MKIVRSIAAVFGGFIVAMVLIVVIESLIGVVYPDHVAKSMDEMKEKLPTMPMGPLLIVVIAWAVGALVGGLAAAVIAGWARCVHGGIIGALVLALTIANFLIVPGHPNWMVIAGLLLPLPMSILAGKLVSPRTPPPVPVSNP